MDSNEDDTIDGFDVFVASHTSGTNMYKEMYRRLKKDLEKEMKNMKDSNGKIGKALDKKKYLSLVSKYKNFKKNSCQHFRFNSAANQTEFGRF